MDCYCGNFDTINAMIRVISTIYQNLCGIKPTMEIGTLYIFVYLLYPTLLSPVQMRINFFLFPSRYHSYLFTSSDTTHDLLKEVCLKLLVWLLAWKTGASLTAIQHAREQLKQPLSRLTSTPHIGIPYCHLYIVFHLVV